jgi:hypothetical protein
MAFIGNVGRVFKGKFRRVRNFLTLGAEPAGNGPISNVAPYVADPRSIIILLGRRGARMKVARANGSGIWSFFEVGPGRYFATEAGVSRQWQIDVAADLSFTVTPITSSFPVNVSSGYVA